MSSISENVDDRLSSLPEDIFSYILSLMPTKFAVQTTILSKRWRYSWMFVMNLYFDDTHEKPDTNSYFDYTHGIPRGLVRFVDQVLKYRKISQVNSFRLHLSNYYLRASSWIDKAVQLNVHELDIHVVNLEAPLSMFTCKTLTKLRLRYNEYDESVWKWPSSVCLPCLKTLDIVVYKIPFHNAFELISGCPVLECLSLEVTIRDDEKNYLLNIPTLKRLKLIFSSVITTVVTEVVLNVPNLEYLFVGGVLCSFFVMEDVSSLVEASISFSEITYNYLWDELLRGISGVKSLSARNLSSHVDINIPFTSDMPIFPNMKHLELKGFWHYRLIHQFLRSAPGLKHLGIEKPVGKNWIKKKLVRNLKSLTTINISIHECWKLDILFLKYMLRDAEVLKTVTITWKHSNNIEEEMQLCGRLRKLPRASTYCEIHFHGNWSRSTIS